MDTLATTLLRRTQERWRLGGSRTSGGQPTFGELQTRRSDGGGGWFADLSVFIASDRDARILEALCLDWNNGNEVMIVERNCAAISLSAASSLGTFAEGSTFSDGALFSSGDVTATVYADAALHATEIRLRVSGPRVLEGGEPFTIIHPVLRDRMYGAARILGSQADGDAILYDVRISPPLREDVAAGLAADFVRPRVVCRIDAMGDDQWPTYDRLYRGPVTLKFRESMRL